MLYNGQILNVCRFGKIMLLKATITKPYITNEEIGFMEKAFRWERVADRPNTETDICYDSYKLLKFLHF